MAEKTQEEPANQSKSLTDSDTSDDTEVNPRFKTSVKERQYNTIPGSVTATHIAHSHSRAQANCRVRTTMMESQTEEVLYRQGQR